MRTVRTLPKTLLLLIPFILCPASGARSLPPEDLEASGDDVDLDMESSGSGGGPPEVILDEKSTRLGSSKDGTVLTNDCKSTNVFKEREVDPWDREPAIVQESRSFIESKEVLAGVIAGGVGGLVLAVLLGGLLIYRWQKKDTAGYTQGHRQDQCYTGQGRDVVLV